MALDVDQEILQDFLVEANEILEQLNEQLVELEQRPDDQDLLNAVFRGFHTVKGGAGFLGLTALVDVCHRAEDVFNLLRNHEREVDSDLMDVVLPVLDVLNSQFDSLRAGEEPEEAEPELLRKLEVLSQPGASLADALGEAPAAEPEQPAEPAPSPEPEAPAPEQPAPAEGGGAEAAPQQVPAELLGGDRDSGDITDEEFEALLDALEGKQEGGGEGTAPAQSAEPAAESASAGSDEEITEDEFEALLDQLHGEGKHGGAPPAAAEQGTGEAAPAAAEAPAATAPPEGNAAAGSSDSDEITEDEFEALLDQLHGEGKHGGVPPGAKPEPSAPSGDAPQAPAAGSGGGEQTPPPEPPKKEEPAKAPAVPEKQEQKPAAEPAAAKKKPDAPAQQAETTVRVDTKRLDDIMNMVGELVLVRNRLATLANAEDKAGSEAKEDVRKAVANLDVVTGDLQTSVMKTRMQPIKKVFGRFPRVVRDLSRSLKKEVSLEMHGEDTDLDKNLVEALADPLVHLVRNAVDHGIEMPDEREAAGKSRSGKLVLSAEQEGDHILLVIEDDGGGMDAEALRKKAVEKGVMDEEAAARLDNKECYNLIFAPGFSTKSEISDISGRGVGMDVVKSRIAQLNGSVEIDSELGQGTRLAIKVPLTLAIMPTLMIKLQEQTFALPLSSVSEIFNLDLTHTNVVDGQLVVMVRDKPLPLYYLTRWLIEDARSAELPQTGYVVVVHVGTQLVGFVVDQLIGQEEVVIKPLGTMLHGTPGMAGATITGDGKIALILDVPGLMRSYSRRH